MTRVTHCQNDMPITYVDEGLGYCRHEGRGWVMFFSLVEPREGGPKFEGKPSLAPIYAVGKAEDNPEAVALEAMSIRRWLAGMNEEAS